MCEETRDESTVKKASDAGSGRSPAGSDPLFRGGRGHAAYPAINGAGHVLDNDHDLSSFSPQPHGGPLLPGQAPGTAAIPSLMVHEPGEPLDKWHTSLDWRMLKAETLWEAGARAGLLMVLVNWPVTFPLKIDNGIQLAASLNPPFRYFYMPLWDIASSSVFSTRKERCNQVPGRAVVVRPRPASDWVNVPKHHGTPLEMSIQVPPVYARGPSYQVLILDSTGDGYDRVLITQSKDASHAAADLHQGERSGWLMETFQTEAGERCCMTDFHLEELEGADSLKLYQSAINTAEAFTLPAELTDELIEVAGPYMKWTIRGPIWMAGVSLDFYLEPMTAHNDW